MHTTAIRVTTTLYCPEQGEKVHEGARIPWNSLVAEENVLFRRHFEFKDFF
jgi:hypothetical protein